MIRMDRMARPQWNALPSEAREAIEARVPDGCDLSILSRYFGGHDFHARVLRGREVIGESAPTCFYVEIAADEALTAAERSTIELRAGWVVEPFVNRGAA